MLPSNRIRAAHAPKRFHLAREIKSRGHGSDGFVGVALLFLRFLMVLRGGGDLHRGFGFEGGLVRWG